MPHGQNSSKIISGAWRNGGKLENK